MDASQIGEMGNSVFSIKSCQRKKAKEQIARNSERFYWTCKIICFAFFLNFRHFVHELFPLLGILYGVCSRVLSGAKNVVTIKGMAKGRGVMARGAENFNNFLKNIGKYLIRKVCSENFLRSITTLKIKRIGPRVTFPDIGECYDCHKFSSYLLTFSWKCIGYSSRSVWRALFGKIPMSWILFSENVREGMDAQYEIKSFCVH